MRSAYKIIIFLFLLIFQCSLGYSKTHLKEDVYFLSYDISCSINKCPDDWKLYETHTNKWRKVIKFDGKASTLKEMVNKSPGCVLVHGSGDHQKVFLLEYNGLKFRKAPIAVAKKMIVTFSDNSKGNADGNRKSAQKLVGFYCAAIMGSHGLVLPEF